METAVMQAPATGVTRKASKGALVLDGDLYASAYQKKGTLSAQLRQIVTTLSEYPSARVGNSLNGNIFSNEDFGFEAQEFVSNENRVGWIDVPEKATKAAVEEQLAKFPDATLYRILDNKPIISDTQKYAIDNNVGDLTLDKIAARQVVRYPEDHATMPNKIIKDKNGKVQYRGIFFSPVAKEDIDNRTDDPNYQYLSEEIIAELTTQGADATVVSNQSL